MAIPARCGSVRRHPNAALEARIMRLFGPGVTEVTAAKVTRAAMFAWDSKPDAPF